MASAWALAWVSLRVVPKASQLFQPSGGDGANVWKSAALREVMAVTESRSEVSRRDMGKRGGLIPLEDEEADGLARERDRQSEFRRLGVNEGGGGELGEARGVFELGELGGSRRGG
jgi:hypothetical protein